MKIGSLFTGYGGLDLAASQYFNADMSWYSEIDQAACKVLKAHHPTILNLGDITAIDWTMVEPVDILTGGYPCQPFSTAGNRKGKDDERHLWPHVLTALNTIRPMVGIFENVDGHRTLGFADVLSDLAEIGWNAEWVTVRASDIGAPHRRQRLFILAYADSESDRKKRESKSVDRKIATTQTARIIRSDMVSRSSSNVYDNKTRTHQVATYATGTKWREPEHVHLQQAGRSTKSRERTLVNWREYEPAVRRWERILGRPAPNPTITHTNGKQRLNAVFVEWMMGLPEGWVTGHGLTANNELKMLGNGVVPQQALLAITQLMETKHYEERET